MITTVGALRRLVREFGLDATLRNQAGLGDTGGNSSSVRDKESILNPPPGLGSPEEQESELDLGVPQKKSQAAVRYADRYASRKI